MHRHQAAYVITSPLPSHTLPTPYPCRLEGDTKSIMYQLSEEAMAQSSAARQSRVNKEAKGPAQIAMERAQYTMNTVAAGERTWDDVRGDLAELFKMAGQHRVADLVTL